ncbi:MAG: hypothetical protein E7651_08040 [Ruminococcaceae bacterium]|nr:hypothetical protein [Oscillospiraceae bacterium]
MKRFWIILCLVAVLLTGCTGGGETSRSGELSPGLEHLREEAILYRHTALHEDLSFSSADFCALTGEETSYIVVSTLPETGVLMLGGVAVLSGQTVPVSSLDLLKYVPAGKTGEETFTFTAKAPGWEERELSCVITVGKDANFPPVTKELRAQTLENLACFAPLGGSDPNGDEVLYRIAAYPRHGSVEIVNGEAVYRPEEGFTGEDSFTYIAADRYGSTSPETKVTFTVAENETGLYFEDLADSPVHSAAIRLCGENVMTYRLEKGKYYFDPEATVSKIDCLVMMMCLMGQDEGVTAAADTEALDDKGLSSGKKGFLRNAIATGWVYLEQGKFSPDAPVTAADAVYMAMRMLGTPALSPKQEFSDLNTTPAWACTALVSADSTGIWAASDGMLDASRVLTKADLAKLFENMRSYGKG